MSVLRHSVAKRQTNDEGLLVGAILRSAKDPRVRAQVDGIRVGDGASPDWLSGSTGTGLRPGVRPACDGGRPGYRLHTQGWLRTIGQVSIPTAVDRVGMDVYRADQGIARDTRCVGVHTTATA